VLRFIIKTYKTTSSTELGWLDIHGSELGIDGVVKLIEAQSDNPMDLSLGYHLATPEGERQPNLDGLIFTAASLV